MGNNDPIILKEYYIYEIYMPSIGYWRRYSDEMKYDVAKKKYDREMKWALKEYGDKTVGRLIKVIEELVIKE
jgi:hypothetical protein